MAIKSNAGDTVQRWRAGVAANSGRYAQGIGKVTDWAEKATAPSAVQARNQGLQAAISDGRIDAGIQRLGTTNWRNATQAKAGNWLTGVNSPQAQANATAGFQRLFGYLQAAEGSISSMPRGTVEENIARFSTWARTMHDQAQQAKNR